jgi:triacylglycerol lipase
MPVPRVQAPIVLVHGILGFDKLPGIGSYFRNIPAALRSAGNIVPEPPQLNTAGSIEERADCLQAYLTNPDNVDVFGKPVHLIAHSMGGLDSRHLISRNQNGIADQVLSLTTLGTPHQGSPVADWIIKRADVLLDVLIDKLKIDLKGVADLTTQAAAQFNERNPDAASVTYFSIAGVFDPGPIDLLRLTNQMMIETGAGPNDGMVPLSSARYTSSESTFQFLETWPVDHFRLVNQFTDLIPVPQELTDDSIVAGYLRIIERLNAEGF